MVSFSSAVRLRNSNVALKALALALACSSQLRVEPHSAARPEPPPHVVSPGSAADLHASDGHGTSPHPERCDSVGPMACSMPVSSHADLCANLSDCVKQAQPEDEVYINEFAIQCYFMDEHDAESAYSRPTPALPGSGVKSTALVTLMALDQNGSTVFESAFLVADFVEGSCLIDPIHQWNLPSTIADTTFATAWKPMPQGYRVEVRSHQVLHESLNSEELEAGESDVRSDYCTRITYDVTGGRFRPVSRDSTEGSCDDD